MKIFIKYMVSIRCKMVVKAELEKLGLHYTSVELGETHILETPTAEQFEELKTVLLRSGLELMDDKKSVLIERIKNVIVEMVHYSDELPRINFSDFISAKLNYDYTYLSNLFSEVQGTTIEHYIIVHKIERVKELLTYEEMSLTAIAALMQYSSVSHLANQFKKITGLTTSHFKGIKIKRPKGLEDV